MSLDFEPSILARIAAKCAPTIAVVGSLDVADVTDEAAAPVIAQIVMGNINPSGQTGATARVELLWSFSVLVDVGRASSAQKTAAWTLVQDAGNALVGWEIIPGREVQIVASEDSGFDGRVRKLSFGFSIPAHFVGSSS